MSCCPEPQIVTAKMCNTFNTNVEADNAQQIFEHTNGVTSGYVTLSNFNASAGPASLSTDAAGTNIIIADVAPDNSYTVYVPNISELYVFSPTGATIIGQVNITTFQTVRP